ncbi:MAG: SOS-response transcriptional repressor LexA [Maribacter sp.]
MIFEHFCFMFVVIEYPINELNRTVMIGGDRIILNERFVKIFAELEKQGKVVKNDRGGKGMGDFAEKILGNRGYGHIVRAFLNKDDKRVLDYKHIEPLAKYYGVNKEYLLHGMKPVFGKSQPRNMTSDITMPMMHSGNIIFTSVSALAGSGIDAGSSSSEKLSSFTIPGVAGSGLYALEVEGDSMEPLLNDGEIVICEQVDYLNEIKDNEVCVIKVDGDVWIKYVQLIKDRAGRITQLKLISENKLEYDPFEVDMNEGLRIYKVIRRISTL